MVVESKSVEEEVNGRLYMGIFGLGNINYDISQKKKKIKNDFL